MSRGIAFVVAAGLAVVPGCSNLLGFHQPIEAVDAGPGGDGAPAGDFTIQTALATARVPAGSFDFIAVVITRGTGDAAPIAVSGVQPPSGVMVTGTTIASADTTGQVEITGTTALTIGSAFMLEISATDGTHTHDVMVPTTVTGIPGTLDVTFGSNNNGVEDVSLGTDVGNFNAITIDGSDDVIAVGVEAQELGDTPEITILGANGDIDSQTTENPGSTTNGGEFYAVAISGTGRIITAGISHNNNDSASPDEPFIAAFTGSGVLDSTFGSGFEFIDLGQDIQNNAMAVDGTNLLFQTSSSQAYRIPASGGGIDLGWNSSNGALAVGITATGPQSITADTALHVYVVGQSGGHAVLERITEAGVIDTAFGSNGIVDSGIAGSAAAAVVQSDHAVLVGATTAGGNFVLFRVLSTGAFDATFGTAGVAQPALPLTGVATVTLTGMTVQSDGKIVVAGNGSAEAVLARYLSDGTLDPTFGTGGAATIPAGLSPFIDGVALQSTGMIIIGGGNADQPHSNGLDGNGYVARVWF